MNVSTSSFFNITNTWFSEFMPSRTFRCRIVASATPEQGFIALWGNLHGRWGSSVIKEISIYMNKVIGDNTLRTSHCRSSSIILKIFSDEIGISSIVSKTKWYLCVFRSLCFWPVKAPYVGTYNLYYFFFSLEQNYPIHDNSK